MTFLWPSALVGLALIPLLLLLYVWMQRRRRRYAVRYSSLSLVRLAVPSQSRLKRYLPMTLFFLALASLVMGLARPVVAAQVPAGRATVMLVLDVSGSMNQNDVRPTRLLAAEKAAMEFVDKQKSTNQIGIVAFASIAQLVQAPTTDPEKLEQAISSLTTGRRTAIGDGIVAALDAISRFSLGDGQQAVPTTEGNQRPDVIVLLTDGVNNAGIDPLKAAQRAADEGVRVYTIGYGTQAGGTRPDPSSGGGFGGRGGGFGGRGGIDEKSLQAIASATGGKYYTATSAGELQSVFDNLPTVLITRQEIVEISVVAAALAAMLVIASLLLSQLWHPLP